MAAVKKNDLKYLKVDSTTELKITPNKLFTYKNEIRNTLKRLKNRK